MKQHDGSCIIHCYRRLLVSLLDLKNKSKDNLLTQSLIYTLRGWPNLKPTQWNNYCGGKFFPGWERERKYFEQSYSLLLGPKEMLFNQKTTKLKITSFLSTLVFLAQKVSVVY